MNAVQTQKPPIRPVQMKFYKSSIGRKIFMALTGLFLFCFLIGHLLGNLQIFLGQNQLNAYAQFLKNVPALTYTVRFVLLVIFVVHVWFAVNLYFENRGSRSIKYKYNATVQASLASRTMFWTGLGVFLYIVYHLLQFTFVATNPQYAHLTDASGRHDVYSMVVLGFQNYLISAVYLVALFLVAYHLTHALFSFLQTLGLNNPRLQPTLKGIAYVVSVVIFIGYASIPVAVLTGIINLPAGGY
jgi:succinate dehydrogenase / fumarate reductase cytochrome b subunit